MAKLNQILAIETGTKPRVYADITTLDKTVQKPELFTGFSKTYEPIEEGGETYPPERKRVQHTADGVLRSVATLSTELMDIVARKDWTNCHAKAAVVLDDKEIIPPAPVSYLLFLEKQLTDLRTLVGRMPILDEADEWTHDEEAGLWKTEPISTIRTKKEPKAIVLLQPTKEHPGQAQMVAEDKTVGYWRQIKLSGALPKPKRDALAMRIERLLLAVKEARESANSHDEVQTPKIGDVIFTHLLGD